jgi:pimeloyl-ACP methyl ester carboxylesterase
LFGLLMLLGGAHLERVPPGSALQVPLKDYDATVMAREINVPTLLLSGRYDFITDGMMKPWFDLIPKVKWAVLAKSSHMSSLEEPERYLELLNGFLSESDKRGHPTAR